MKKHLLFVTLLTGWLIIGCSSSKDVQKNTDWIQQPMSGLDEGYTFAAVGSGSSLEKAKEKAFRELGYQFGVNIKSRTVQTTSYSETRAGSQTASEQTSKMDEELFLLSNTDLSYVTYDQSAEQNGVWYARAVLDKTAFGLDLSQRLNNLQSEVLSGFETAKKSPLQLLKYSQNIQPKLHRLRQWDAYLTVLNMNSGNSELSELTKNIEKARKSVGLMIDVLVSHSEDKEVVGDQLLKSAITDEIRRTNPEFLYTNTADDVIYIVIDVKIDRDEVIGKDQFVYSRYNYMVMDKEKELLERSAGNAKGAGISPQEAMRQTGVKIARQLLATFSSN